MLIIGGGAAGISVAARLLRADVTDIGVIEPSETHFYQPLWTLVGDGCATAEESVRAVDWGKVPGMAEAVATPAASSNYAAELASKTWQIMRGMRSGTALFTMPLGPIKCAGAPQKIAYLCADH